MRSTVYEVCANAMNGYFRQGMKILDYGCGPGLFADYMVDKLNEFTYYGVEPNSRYGRKSINEANTKYNKDDRMTFGYIGEDIETEAIENTEVVLLLSVFTHLDIEQTEEILSKLKPIIERKGIIVFTIIHGEEYKIGDPGMYSLPTTYSVVYNTKEQVGSLADKFNVDIDLKGTWYHKHDWLHSIYQMKASQ